MTTELLVGLIVGLGFAPGPLVGLLLTPQGLVVGLSFAHEATCGAGLCPRPGCGAGPCPRATCGARLCPLGLSLGHFLSRVPPWGELQTSLRTPPGPPHLPPLWAQAVVFFGGGGHSPQTGDTGIWGHRRVPPPQGTPSPRFRAIENKIYSPFSVPPPQPRPPHPGGGARGGQKKAPSGFALLRFAPDRKKNKNSRAPPPPPQPTPPQSCPVSAGLGGRHEVRAGRPLRWAPVTPKRFGGGRCRARRPGCPGAAPPTSR